MNTLGRFGSGLLSQTGASSSSSSSTSAGPSTSQQQGQSASNTGRGGRGGRGGSRGGRGRGGASKPVRPPIKYGPETGRKKPGPKPKHEREAAAAAAAARAAAEGTVVSDAKEVSRGRGRGRGVGRGRGRGRGRGKGNSSSLAPGRLDRDSTARRSESEMREGTVGPASGTKAVNTGGDEDEDDEDREGDDDDDEGGLLENLGEEEMKWREEMEKIRGQAMGPLVAAMSDEQYDRHESYRRAGFNRANLKRLINTHLSGGGNQSAVQGSIAMAFGGVAKVFVGEIIEGARRLCPDLPEGTPIPPSAILESYRLYSQSHSEGGALARGRGNAESVHGGSGVGGGMGGRRRLF